MNFRDSRRRRDDVQLDLTPLIDVVFLLLIFFLVTAAYASGEQTVIPVELPQGTSGDQASENEQITVIVRTDDEVLVRAGDGTEEVVEGVDEVRATLDRMRGEFPEAAVFLRGDRGASYGTVMEVLDVARNVGFPRVFNVIED